MDGGSSPPALSDAASSPPPPPAPAPSPSDWRALVASSTHKRRQTPAQQRSTVQRLLARTDAPHPIHLPRVVQDTLRHKAAVQSSTQRAGASTPTSLRKTLRRDFAESKEQLPSTQLNPTALFLYAVQRAERNENSDHADESSTQGAQRRQRRIAPSRTSEEAKEQAAILSPRHIASSYHPPPSHLLPHSRPVDPSSSYQITPPDPSELYKPVISKLEQLPLELFDSTEGDLTPEQWLALGKGKYGEAGLPAKALYYEKGEWAWRPCRVRDYVEERGAWVISFEADGLQKEVKRLSLLFDDEDAERFARRLDECRELREECLSQRRYTSFVNSQSSALFSPIQPATLHGLVGRLVATCERLVVRRQQSVERLLTEVKDEYNKAMKQAIIDYRRKDPVEEQRMTALRLPPQVTPPPPPYLAVVDTGPHLAPFAALCAAVGSGHYTRHPEATAVVLALFRAWASLSSSVFYDLHFEARDSPHPSDPVYPMTVSDFLIFQQQAFLQLRERCQNEWRALLINLIRDNLNAVYKLFVNERDEFDRSELKRFLHVTGCMLRDQLTHLVERSVRLWVDKMEAYAPVVAEMRERSEAGADVLQGYLDEPTPAHPPLRASPCPPLFLFRLSFDAVAGVIVSNPPLASLQTSLVSLLALPAKLTSLTHIDSDVVPLLGLPDRALLADPPAPLTALIADATTLTSAVIAASLVQPEALMALYLPYAQQLAASATLAAAFAAQPHSLAQTRAEVERYRALAATVEALSPNAVAFRALVCDVVGLKADLIARCDDVVAGLLAALEAEVRADCDAMGRRCEEMRAKLEVVSADVYAMAQLTSFVAQCEGEAMAAMRADIAATQAKVDVLLHFQHPIAQADYHACLALPRFPVQLTTLLARVRGAIAGDRVTFAEQLAAEQIDLSAQLDAYLLQVDTFSEYGLGTTAQMEQYGGRVELLAEQLDKAERMAETFKQRRALFPSDALQPAPVGDEWKELVELRAKFTPYFELWSTTSLFNSNYSVWMTGPFSELDADAVTRDVTAWMKAMTRLEKLFLNEDLHKPAKVASEMKAKLTDFKQSLPIISWLRAPGLRARHWERLQLILSPTKGVVLHGEGSELTLAQLLALPLAASKVEIEEICNAADKEYGLEVGLDKMQREWKGLSFTLEAYKASGTWILKQADEILTLLDDQLMKTQAIKGSPYIKCFEARARKWEGRLQLISSIMEEWLACQKTWMYLEPIFSSEDIMRQMPVEGRRFGVVDSYWRKTMDNAKRVGNILDFVSETEGILKTLQESNKMLDLIGKHLNEYLETKRLAFPRFYFLSNDELLSILSQTKNAKAVQPHLSKCFDAMNALVFQGDADAPLITGMTSGEGEVVAFSEVIDPNAGAKKGNVELWLKEVEEAMRTTLRRQIHAGMQSYPQQTREDWVLRQTGQVVLAITCTYWTREVTQALKAGKKGLEAQLEALNRQLDGLVGLVRRTDLTELNRAVLGALTVLDVHARDVVSRLIEQGVKDEGEFEWLAQMRHYYEEDGQHNPLSDDTTGRLSVKMINAQLAYGYEYLGVSTRLVVTPLTDRCYRTLMGAIHLHLGGAPEGPAGTGKSQRSSLALTSTHHLSRISC